jgi:hypothetical protein
MQIAADLGPEHVNASTADVLATLRFHGIVEKPQKQRQACGGARGAAAGGGRRGGNADTRLVRARVFIPLRLLFLYFLLCW